jgi:tetratricopeptide (TPR) repeat protein
VTAPAEDFFNRAEELYDQGELEAAVTAYRRGLEKRPENLIAINNLAMALMDLERYADARDELERALEAGATDPGIRANLGHALRKLGKHLEAAEVYEAYLAEQPDAEEADQIRAWIRRVRSETKIVHRAAAEPGSASAESAAPPPADEAEVVEADAVLVEAEDAAATAATQGASDAPPAAAPAPPAAAPAPPADPAVLDRRLERGEAAYESGAFDEAAALFEQAAEMAPAHAAALSGLGRARAKAGDLGGALHALRAAEARSPESSDLPYVIGYVLRALGRDAEAAASYERFLALEPASPDAEKIRGWIDEVKAAASPDTGARPAPGETAGPGTAETPEGAEAGGLKIEKQPAWAEAMETPPDNADIIPATEAPASSGEPAAGEGGIFAAAASSAEEPPAEPVFASDEPALAAGEEAADLGWLSGAEEAVGPGEESSEAEVVTEPGPAGAEPESAASPPAPEAAGSPAERATLEADFARRAGTIDELLAKDETLEALNAAQELAMMFPDRPGARVLTARAFAARGEPEKALAVLERGGEGPEDEAVLYYKALSLRALGREEEARDVLGRVLTMTNDPDLRTAVEQALQAPAPEAAAAPAAAGAAPPPDAAPERSASARRKAPPPRARGGTGVGKAVLVLLLLLVLLVGAGGAAAWFLLPDIAADLRGRVEGLLGTPPPPADPGAPPPVTEAPAAPAGPAARPGEAAPAPTESPVATPGPEPDRAVPDGEAPPPGAETVRLLLPDELVAVEGAEFVHRLRAETGAGAELTFGAAFDPPPAGEMRLEAREGLLRWTPGRADREAGSVRMAVTASAGGEVVATASATLHVRPPFALRDLGLEVPVLPGEAAHLAAGALDEGGPVELLAATGRYWSGTLLRCVRRGGGFAVADRLALPGRPVGVAVGNFGGGARVAVADYWNAEVAYFGLEGGRLVRLERSMALPARPVLAAFRPFGARELVRALVVTPDALHVIDHGPAGAPRDAGRIALPAQGLWRELLLARGDAADGGTAVLVRLGRQQPNVFLYRLGTALAWTPASVHSGTAHAARAGDVSGAVPSGGEDALIAAGTGRPTLYTLLGGEAAVVRQAEPVTLPLPGPVLGLAAADLDADGGGDAVAFCPRGICIRRHAPDGTPQPVDSLPLPGDVPPPLGAAAPADLTGDGIDDVAWLDRAGRLRLLSVDPVP